MKRNLNCSKTHLLSIAFLLLSCLSAIKANAQTTCKLSSKFSYNVVGSTTHVNFQDLTTDSSTGGNFSLSTLNLSPGSKAPTDIITGDFNLDGKLDIINTDSGSNTVTELLGIGNGTFSGAISFPTGGNGPVTVVSGDFNSDGKPDLAVVNALSNTVSIMLGEGNGVFSTPVQYNTGTNPYMVVTADFNSDGILDLAVTNTGSNNISLFWGNGDGTFTTVTALSDGSGTTPKSMATADFNGDGKADLAVANYGNNTICVYLGNGSGGFSITSGSPYQAQTPWGIIATDFNGDGRPDLIASNYFGSDLPIFINKNDGTGNLVADTSRSVPIGTGVRTRLINVGDVNGDGIQDVIVPVPGTDFINIFYGSGKGAFPSSSIVSIHSLDPYGAVCGDFNGDGKIDIANTNVTSGNITLLLNTIGTTITSWHWNFGDGDTSNLQNSQHTYAADTNYNVCLTVTNSLGCTNQYCKLVNSSLCTGGVATSVRDTICIGTTGNLMLSGSTGSIQWQSSIDDVNFTDITAATSFKYKTPPLNQTTWYRAKVDSGACSAISDTTQLYVPVPLIVYFSSTQTGANQLTFNSDSSSIGAIRSYHWDFGDNTTSTTPNPVHTYATDTPYHVCLTLYDGSNCSYTYCRDVTVVSQTQPGGQISPAYSIICSGSTELLKVTGASGNNYQWQISPDNSNWSNISGATDTTYTTSGADGDINEFYRLMTQNGASTVAEVDVSQPIIAIWDTSIAGTVLLVWGPRGMGNYNVTYSGPSSGLLTGVTPPETISGLVDGTYTFEVTQTGLGGCSASGTTEVVVSNATCKLFPQFSYSTDNGNANFTGSAIDSMVGATIASWQWDFGDGDTSNVQNPIHTYAIGHYTACLSVTNSFGCTNQYCNQVNITNGSSCHLAAQFSYTLNDSSGLAIFRDLSTDTTNGVTINSWSWNFNVFGGTSTLQNPSFTFPVDSVYHVCLTVTNSIGCSNTSCQNITVNKVTGPCNITPQFSYTSDATGLGSFVDLSTDSSGTIDSWHWNFGDLGSPSDDSYVQNPTHAFTTSSIYNVCLTAGNSFGCVNTVCKQVPITSTISSLCVSVFPQDSNLITQTGQQSEEYYLIKEFNTANGDSLALVDTFTVNSSLNTSHCFTNLPNGTYYVKAEFMPGSTQYSNYLPSYYNGVLLWDNATPLNLNGSQFVSLMLLKGTNSGGPGFIGGYVSQGANRLEQGASTNAVGDPEPGKTVILTSVSGDAVAHTLTDAKGYFQFSNLAFGTYYLAVDELNKPCTPLEVTINDSTGYHESANFQMNSKSISSQIALGTYTIIQHPFAVSLAGNPVGNELTLHLQNMAGDAIISVTDLLGRELLTNNAPQQSTLARLNVQNLASGVYLVTVNSGSDVKTIKFVKE